jgi:spermidine synthase
MHESILSSEKPPMNFPIIFALLLMGFTFTITQVMVIRELLVVFVGNELSSAIILANWLLLEAAGSFLLGRKVKDLGMGKGSYAFLQLLLSIFLPLTIYGIRSLRDLIGLPLGEGASLLQIFFWTAPILAPLGMIDGILFALGCSLHSDRTKKTAISIGRVYLLEALGAGAGGVLYTFFFMPNFGSFQVAFLLGTANLISAILLVSTREQKKKKKRVLSGLFGSWALVEVLMLISSGAGTLEKNSMDRQWRGVQVLESRWSPYSHVTVGRREEQLTFFSNGMPICNVPTPDIAFVEEMVHYPLLGNANPQVILIIGGGLGGVINEALKHPVKEIHYTEIDPLIIQLIQENLTPLTRLELGNPRVQIHTLDGRLFIKTTLKKFDGIILNLPTPSTLELNRFYTVEFFKEVSRVLRKGGILALAIPGSETYLSPEGRDLNVSLLRSLREVFPAVYVIPGDTNFILASTSSEAGTFSPERLIGRLQERKIAVRFLTGFQIRQKLARQRLEWLESSLKRGGAVKLNRDAHPSGLYYAIAYWNAQFHPSLQILWGRADGLRLWHLGILLLILVGGAFILRKRGGESWGKKAVIAVVVTTGFFGTAMSVLLIFSFQTLYGYAYQWIGLLIAAFMVGLALGSWRMTGALEKIHRMALTLVAVEVLILAAAALTTILLTFFYSPALGTVNSSPVRFGFLLLTGIAGILVGLEFPLSSRIFTASGEGAGRSAGILYASDLFGAWAGSLLVGVLLIPVLGIFQTCVAIILLKLASLSLVGFVSRKKAAS